MVSVGSGGELKTVRQVLVEKHPKGQPLQHSTLVNADATSQEPYLVMFEQINGGLLCDTALKTEGGAGPSGIDPAGYRGLAGMCWSARWM